MKPLNLVILTLVVLFSQAGGTTFCQPWESPTVCQKACELYDCFGAPMLMLDAPRCYLDEYSELRRNMTLPSVRYSLAERRQFCVTYDRLKHDVQNLHFLINFQANRRANYKHLMTQAPRFFDHFRTRILLSIRKFHQGLQEANLTSTLKTVPCDGKPVSRDDLAANYWKH